MFIVTFISKLKNVSDASYALMAERMEKLVSKQPGYLGMDSVRDSDGRGITVCYWSSLQAIEKWKSNDEHRLAQEKGKTSWYESYKVIVSQELDNP